MLLYAGIILVVIIVLKVVGKDLLLCFLMVPSSL